MTGLIQLFIEQPIVGLVIIVAISIAIAIHEAAHAYSANYLGDTTPKLQGRLTLNPLKHLDPIGTIFLVLVGIGWGKPVEFNPNNLKNPRKDAAIIAIAGPISNIVMAVGGFILTQVYVKYFFSGMPIEMSASIYGALEYFVTINLVLAVFNMIPLDPLDGFKVVAGVLPRNLVPQWYETKRFGMIILIILLITGMVSRLTWPVVTLFQNILNIMFGFI